MNNNSEITVSQLRQLVATSAPVLLDIRDAHSYIDSHINGALFTHEGTIQNLIKKKQYEQPIVIYCYRGSSSKDMAEFFSALGFSNVYSLKGGYVEWKKLLEPDELLQWVV